MLALHNISVNFGEKRALQQIDITVPAGEVMALLGPNGAGKSTIFNLLCMFLTPQQGHISWNDVDITRQRKSFLARTGVVFQQSTLDLDLSVRQNLAYHAALHGMNPERCGQRISEECSAFEITDVINKKVRALNGGHRRRVELARAMLHEPEVLLLDEPTVGLDPSARDTLRNSIDKLCQQRGTTVLWSTHLFGELSATDNVVFLHRGEIRDRGIIQDLLQKHACTSIEALYHQLCGGKQ